MGFTTQPCRHGGIVLHDGPVAIVGEIGSEATACPVDECAVEEVVGERSPAHRVEVRHDGSDRFVGQFHGVPQQFVEEISARSQSQSFSPFGRQDRGHDVPIVGKGGRELGVFCQVVRSHGVLTARGAKLAATDALFSPQFFRTRPRLWLGISVGIHSNPSHGNRTGLMTRI